MCKRLKRQLMDLPMDMLVNILLRLPVESLRRIRCVSKTLLNTVDNLAFVYISWYGMGYDHITNTYKIVRVSTIFSEDDYCTTHDMHWLLRRSPRGSGVTKSHIISFNFKKEMFHWTPTPPTFQSSNKDSNLHLLTLRGSIAIVETFPSPEGGGMKVEIWMMKVYAKKEWAKEYNINVDMQPEFGLKYAICGWLY
ncbi:uncharacterized protein LOC126795349 [Argentina anserina]|uniref:uncharacterized protein LOC126795349 n=1 Tax=Argentina anserina TaxID=57926 RepID=UPI0021767589|nr:uncharacterized protein LOC126795349 [Potentilla anserina]